MSLPPHRLNQKEPHIFILIIMSSFASMGAIIFAPALPEIAQYFHISTGSSQLTITLFLLGYAVGQLIYGPIANRYGRKPAFYIGIVIATLGSVISIASEPLHSFHALIFGRLLEALGSSAGLVISFTIISDHYYPDQARRIIAYLMLAFAIVPGIATLIGGILTSHFHWISCFYFLLIYGLLLIIPVTCLLETAQELKMDAMQIRQIFQNYRIALKNQQLAFTTLFFGLSGMCVYVYVASAPFIAINRLGLSPQGYGLIGLIPFLGTALGSIVSAQLSSRFSAKALMLAGFITDTIAAIGLAALFYLGMINLIALIGCGFILMFGNCLIVGNGASIATSTAKDKANASAMMNFINVGMVMLGTFLLAITPGNPIIKLPIGFLIAMVAMSVVWFRFISITRI
jgi:DHA1 family bicyclomycin/chloramphenicol resistance-like MFS transporter